MKIVFISTNQSFLDLCAARGFKVFCGSVKEYYPFNEAKSVFYMSPINALGFMEYSYDKELAEMFTELQQHLNQKINQLGYPTLCGRKYLPIGKAIATECKSFTQQHRNFIISSPICMFPQDISTTQNIYFSMIGMLQLIQKYENYISDEDELIIPAIGCNDVNNVSPEKSFEQIMNALSKLDSLDTIVINYQEILYKQPRTYANREFGLNIE